jgi:hypothetical protein
MFPVFHVFHVFAEGVQKKEKEGGPTKTRRHEVVLEVLDIEKAKLCMMYSCTITIPAYAYVNMSYRYVMYMLCHTVGFLILSSDGVSLLPQPLEDLVRVVRTRGLHHHLHHHLVHAGVQPRALVVDVLHRGAQFCHISG